MDNLEIGKENRKLKKSAVLIDGSGFIYRAFFALPKLTRSDGAPTGAVFGFCSMLLSLISDHASDVFIVILDSGRDTFRSKIYEAYKKNRDETPPELKAQFETLIAACHAFGVPVVLKTGYEADDIIATYAHKLSKKGYKTEIVSSDKDLMQLVDENVSMYDPMKSKFIQKEEVFEKYGVYPESMVFLQALMGDSSDNIPGVPGVGPKTATKLISAYQDLENLYNSLDEIPQEKLKEKLQNNKHLADISLKLVTLEKNVEINENFEELHVNSDVTAIVEFLKEQEFNSLIPRVTKKLEKQQTKRNFIKLNSLDDFKSFCNRRLGCKFSFFSSSCDGEYHILALSTEKDTAYIKFNFSADLFSSGLSFGEIKKFLIPYFADENIQKIGFKNSIEYFGPLSSFDDISVMSFIAHGVARDKIGDLFPYADASLKNLSFNKICDADSICKIAGLIFDSYDLLKQELQNADLLDIYLKIDRPMVSILNKMKAEGILVSSEKLKNLKAEFLKRVEEIENKIFEIVGHEFNIASVKQLSEVLFEELKLKKPAGKASTNVEVLEDLSLHADSCVPDLVLSWRKLSKLISTYTDSLCGFISKKTGRIHTTFSLISTVTGRLSSFNPNLQNIPVKTDDGRAIKSTFVAPPGCRLLSCDYSQIELRILASVADIPLLKDAFIKGADIHTKTAAEIFNVSEADVTKDMRRHAKVINFGILYGMSPFGLAKALNISRERASKYLKDHFEKFDGFYEFKNDTLEFARTYGFVKTIFGRRLYIKDISSKNFRLRSFAERQAINAVIQGSAADIVKHAMIDVSKILEDINAKMLLQIHDELVFEVSDENVDLAQRVIKKRMEMFDILSVPLTINMKVGDSL